jgi:hypothetical protein
MVDALSRRSLHALRREQIADAQSEPELARIARARYEQDGQQRHGDACHDAQKSQGALAQ